MNQKINMKEIERKAYTAYHQDGVVDVSVAVVILFFGIIMVGDMPWLGGIGGVSGILAVTLYAAFKKFITVPRLGYVKLPQQRAQRMTAITIALGTLSALMAVVAFFQTTSQGTPDWLLFLIDNYMLTIGIAVAGLFLLGGYAFKTKRIYAYALLTLVMFTTGHFLSFPLYYYLVALGTIIMAIGIVLMILFVQKYPKTTQTTEA
ncbi:MAG: hypothetical protein CW716_05935 [Candidatus Bathyarchaeum sp.]|nr:MAG: hypothetical protein CW716_05935 [Candidatus Bathyarchaeum sp.]